MVSKVTVSKGTAAAAYNGRNPGAPKHMKNLARYADYQVTKPPPSHDDYDAEYLSQFEGANGDHKNVLASILHDDNLNGDTTSLVPRPRPNYSGEKSELPLASLEGHPSPHTDIELGLRDLDPGLLIPELRAYGDYVDRLSIFKVEDTEEGTSLTKKSSGADVELNELYEASIVNEDEKDSPYFPVDMNDLVGTVANIIDYVEANNLDLDLDDFVIEMAPNTAVEGTKLQRIADDDRDYYVLSNSPELNSYPGDDNSVTLCLNYEKKTVDASFKFGDKSIKIHIPQETRIVSSGHYDFKDEFEKGELDTEGQEDLGFIRDYVANF